MSETIEKQSGIPKAVFVDDVDAYMSKAENDSAEVVLQHLEEQHQKYKFMEHNLVTKKARLKNQIPEIKTSLDIVRHMKSKQDSTDALETHYQLSDMLYAKAKIPPTDKVCLWLGANVMLEYELNDAQSLLEKNASAADKSMIQTDDDLGFIRDQTTTIEVNMARIYNWDIKRRQALGTS